MWQWKRQHWQAPFVEKLGVHTYATRAKLKDVFDETDEETRVLVRRSPFSHYLRMKVESGNLCGHVLDNIMAHEVTFQNQDLNEFWVRIGEKNIRFSRFEFALMSGLRFGNCDAYLRECPAEAPADGLFSHYFADGGLSTKVEDIMIRYCAGDFRVKSISDNAKIFQVLFLYMFVLGVDHLHKRVDQWVWAIIDDSERWNMFPWGELAFNTLIPYLRDFKGKNRFRYHIYGCTSALVCWLYELVPSISVRCAIRVTDTRLNRPRMIRWEFRKQVKTNVQTLFRDANDCIDGLQPTQKELQLYRDWWDLIERPEHIVSLAEDNDDDNKDENNDDEQEDDDKEKDRAEGFACHETTSFTPSPLPKRQRVDDTVTIPVVADAAETVDRSYSPPPIGVSDYADRRAGAAHTAHTDMSELESRMQADMVAMEANNVFGNSRCGSSSQSHRRRSDSEARQSMKTEPDLERKMEAVEGKPIKMEQGFEGKMMESQEVITNLTSEHLESQHREDKLKESHAEDEHGLKALRARVSTLEAEKKAADLGMEELRREKSEAYVMALKADEMLKESEQRSSEKILELEKVIELVQRRAFLDHQAFMTREKNLRERHEEAEQKLEELHVVVLNLESEKRLMMEESRQRSIKAVEAVEMNIRSLVELKNTLVGELGMTAEDCDKSSNRRLKRKRGVIFGDEIVRALEEDDELCIQAVRQLHKQVLNSECSNTSFYHFEQLWRYEPEVTRPIAEIKQRFPHIVGRCRQLAMEYSSYLVAMPCWSQDEDERSSLSVSLVCRRCFMLKDSHDPGACEEGEETNV